MEYADFTNGFILSFHPGEDLHQTLIDFTLAKRIPGSFYQGSGFFKDIEIGKYDTESNSYKPHPMSGEYEAISLLGNISEVKSSPFPSTQVVLIDRDLRTVGGSLLKGTISHKMELFLFSIDIVINRKGLKNSNSHLDLPHHFQS